MNVVGLAYTHCHNKAQTTHTMGMQQPNTQQGAYLLHDPSASDAVVLVLYLHCTKPKLERALPISFDHVQYDKDNIPEKTIQKIQKYIKNDKKYDKK